MKKLIMILALTGLTSSFCFAQEKISLVSTDGDTINKLFKSYYPKATFEFPDTTALIGFGVISNADQGILASLDCENAVNSKLESLIEESGYEPAFFATDDLNKRIMIKANKGGNFTLWSIKIGFFTTEYIGSDNKTRDVYVCYGYDFSKDEHLKIYDNIMKLDRLGNVVVPDTTVYPAK